jgi:hypothetical protein
LLKEEAVTLDADGCIQLVHDDAPSLFKRR